MNAPNCIFCGILEGRIPATIIAESSDAIMIRDLHPQAPLHYLVIPRKHIASLNDLTATDRTVILPALFEMADHYAHEAGFRTSGYRTVINNQLEAGQSVFHLHIHILAGALRGTFGS